MKEKNVKRYLKNTIIVFIFSLTCTGIYFTIDYIKYKEQTSNEKTIKVMTPLEKPSKESDNMSDQPSNQNDKQC